MYLIFVLTIVSFLIAFALTPVSRDVFLRFGLVDLPDQERKTHARAVPRVGGVPVAIAYFVPFAMLFLFAPGRARGFVEHLPFRWEFPMAAFVVFVAGLLDDVRGLRPWQKLVAQVGAASLACWGGVRIFEIHSSPLAIWLSVPMTVVWLVGCTNAFNLIDGIDGLAAGVGVFATLTISLAAVLHHNVAVLVATVPLAASLLGFLRYNFNPASIFLGDSGSMLVGFLLGCYAVLWSEESATILGTMAPITALALPLLDTSLAIARRFLRGQPIFAADRRHIHHRLLDRGLTPRRAVFLLYGFCAVAAALSLLQSTREQFAGPVIVLFCAAFWIGVQRLGYVEFGALGRMLAEAASLRALHARIHVCDFHEALVSAKTPDECWQAVLRYYKRFGFSQVTLHLGGKMYSATHAKSMDPSDAWTIVVPFSARDFARLSRDGAEVQSFATAAFADTLAATLKGKAGLWRADTAAAIPVRETGRMSASPELVS